MSGFPREALPFLRCPVCAATLVESKASLRCANGHNFDVAHQGYVNLLPGDARPGTADSAEMVAARETFLGAGHYAGLREFVCDVAQRALAMGTDGAATPNRAAPRSTAPDDGLADPGCIVEVGAGTGYYLARLLERLPGRVGLALDISKFAARRAARAHARMGAVVCDAWHELPVVDGAASLVLDIFAPRNPGEFRRILGPGGALVIVVPTRRHLQELVEVLGLVTVDERKAERLEHTFEGSFQLAARETYEQSLALAAAEAATFVRMGPSARHTLNVEVVERLSKSGHTTTVTISVEAAIYTPRTPADRERQ